MLSGCLGGDDSSGDDGNGNGENGEENGNENGEENGNENGEENGEENGGENGEENGEENGGENGEGNGNGESEDDWIQLFNGEDLDDWIPKVRESEVGEDPFNTWRVEDGLLKVRYDEYDDLSGRFGHLFYDDVFDHYIVHTKYRFPEGAAVPNDQANWNYKNNGLMLHGERPEEMDVDQDFPRSVEYQLVGPYGDDSDRPLGDVCTPGTHAERLNGDLVEDHCWNENSEEDVLGTDTYRGNDWVHAIAVVRSNELTQHIIWDHGIAIEYQNPQTESDGTIIEEGTISIQSEGHPTDFEVIELLPLDPDDPMIPGEIPDEVEHLMEV